MRILSAVTILSLALGGCASVRKGLGEYQKAADKGVTFGGGPDRGGPAESNAVSAGASSAPAKHGRQDLPAGLGGDKAHADYTATPQS